MYSRLSLSPRVVQGIAFLLYGLAVAILLAWLIYLSRILPAVSRADFVLALWKLLPSLENNDIPGIAAGVFRIFGGHIVAYERLLQIANYWLFDYSPLVVKYAAIGTIAIAWAGFARLARVTLGRGLSAPIVVLLATGLICSPVTYTLIGWPDSILPYYSCFIAFSLLLPGVCRWMERTKPVDFLWLAIAAFAVICGSGVGWAVLPTFAITATIAKGGVERMRRMTLLQHAAAIAAVTAVVFLVRWLVLQFMEAYEQALYLDDARTSLLGIVTHPLLVVKYFFAVLATNFVAGTVEETYSVGIVVFLVWLCLIVRCVAIGETQRFNVWISFAVFGLLSVLLTTLTRWEFVITRGVINAAQYYSVFALPFHLGLLGLAFTLARDDIGKESARLRLMSFANLAVVGALVVFAAYRLSERHSIYLSIARDSAAANAASIAGAPNRNMLLLAEFAGTSDFAEMYLLGVLHDFKRVGKFPALTAGFIEDGAAFAAEHEIPHPLSASALRPEHTERCLPKRGDGRVAISQIDERRPWRWAKYPTPEDNVFFRFAGYSIDPGDCGQAADFVFAADRDGRILCVSRPGLENASTVEDPFLPPTENRKAVFDFSCPLSAPDISHRGPFTVLSYFKKQNRISALPFIDPLVDGLSIKAELTKRGGQDQVFVDGKPVEIMPERAGWISPEAGRSEGQMVIFDGWALDRRRNRTAAAILLFEGERLIYEVEPDIPFPSAEVGITLANGRRAGFRMSVPAANLAGNTTLRIFALTEQREVSELYYPEGFPSPVKR